MKKYKLTNICYPYFGKFLYRIECITAFSNVKVGDLGGYIESESNLSQEGDCWVYDDAKVTDKAELAGNAKIYDTVTLEEDAIVYENAEIHGNTLITDRSNVHGNVKIQGGVIIQGEAEITENVEIQGKCRISGTTYLEGNAKIKGNVEICENSSVWENAEISGNVRLEDNASIGGSAKISGDVKIDGYANISGDAIITDKFDYLVLKDILSYNYITWTRSNDKWNIGNSLGTDKELLLILKNKEEKIRNYYQVFIDIKNKYREFKDQFDSKEKIRI